MGTHDDPIQFSATKLYIWEIVEFAENLRNQIESTENPIKEFFENTLRNHKNLLRIRWWDAEILMRIGSCLVGIVQGSTENPQRIRWKINSDCGSDSPTYLEGG